MSDRIVIGLDPATRASGYAVMEDDRVLVASFYRARGVEACGNRVAQVAEIYSWARFLVVKWALNGARPLVAVETVWFGPNAQTTLRLAEVGAVVRLAAHRAGADVVDVSPAERCKALSLPVTAGKGDVMRAVNAIYGLEVMDHNAADAVAIAAAGAGIHRREELAR